MEWENKAIWDWIGGAGCLHWFLKYPQYMTKGQCKRPKVNIKGWHSKKSIYFWGSLGINSIHSNYPIAFHILITL